MVARQQPQVKVIGRSTRRSSKEQRAARRQRQVRQAAHHARHPRPRREVAYRPWRRLRRDQQAVAKRLTAGQIDLVTISGWGIVGQFVAFLEGLCFFALLDVDSTGFQRVMIPIARLVLTYQVKILLGISSINLVPLRLFRDHALWGTVGFCRDDGQRVFQAQLLLPCGGHPPRLSPPYW